MVSKLTEERTFIVVSGTKVHWLVRPDSDEFRRWRGPQGVESLGWSQRFSIRPTDRIVLPAEYLT